MLRYFLLLPFFAALFNANHLRSQPPPMEFGKLSPLDLKMRVFEADTTAAAVVLCDFATAVVEPHTTSYHLVWTHHKRIKLLNKQGFDYANIIIPFYSKDRREEFLFDKAAVYLPDGTQFKLTRKDVVVEQINDYYSLAKFTFPQVAEGCIVEYAYTITSKSIYELREWFFQSDIPTLKSEIRADFPKFVDYVYLFQGNEGMEPMKDKDGNTRFAGKNGSFLFAQRRFVMENAPAMKEEAYITTMDDYRARIRFQLAEIAHDGGYIEKVMSDWPKLQKDLSESSQFGDQLLKKANYKKMTEKLLPMAAGQTGAREKAWFFHDYLTKNIRWDEGYSMYTEPKKLSDIFEQGEASSGELNMMLYVLLTESGIMASPVLLSTRSHGKMYEEYPILDQFNHLIVAVDIEGKQVFLDATDRMRPPGYPSIPSLNGRGLKLDFATGRPTWINITPPRDGADVLTFDLHLDAEGTLSGTLTTTHKGYNAMPERRGSQGDNAGGLWQKRLAGRFPDAVVSSAKLGNLDAFEKPFYDTLEISIPNAAQVSGDRMYLAPVPYSEFDENIFKLKERLYPVDIPYPFVSQTVLNLTLPEGYEIESLPKMANQSVPSGGGNYFFASTPKSDGTVQFSASLNISKQKFLTSDYPALKELFELMVKKQEDMVVIKKKG